MAPTLKTIPNVAMLMKTRLMKIFKELDLSKLAVYIKLFGNMIHKIKNFQGKQTAGFNHARLLKKQVCMIGLFSERVIPVP